jgi:restriction system protein
MASEVECRNLRLGDMEEELEGILAATLGVDDFVDLNTLRAVVEHPPFSRQDLRVPARPPLPIADPPMPEYTDPPAPRGLLSFLSKNQHEKAKASAVAKYHEEMAGWHATLARNEERRAAETSAYEERERTRAVALQEEEDRYAADCARREAEADARNREVDALITNLSYGTSDAIEEYIGIVLSNAVYPEHFPINHDYAFDPSVAELRLAVAVISPEQLPTVKAYKYVKASDEIAEVPFSPKACKDRYAGAVHQVALRVPHEIFEADRRGLIATISLKVGTHGCDPATGASSFIPLLALGVAREDFMKIELANVQPSATLAHLGASISKNPYGLVPANISGVRRS